MPIPLPRRKRPRRWPKCAARYKPLVAEVLEPRHLLAGTASISGTVWNDLNGDGAIGAGETGRPGVTVYLDLDDSGALNGAEPSRETASDGSYLFQDLDAGSYLVRQITPANHRITFPQVSGQRLLAVDTSSNPDRIVELNPASGAVLRSIPSPVANTFGDVGLAFDGKTLYYVSDSNDTLYELNPTSGAILDSTVLTSGYYGSVAVLAGKVYVLDWLNEVISIFDPATNTIVGSHDLDSLNPGLSVEDALGNAASTAELVTATSSSIEFLNSTTGVKASSFPIPLSFSLSSVEAIGGEVYVGYSSPAKIDVYSRSTQSIVRTLPVTFDPKATAGYGDHTGSNRLTLTAGQNAANVNFGDQFVLVSLSGTRWHDASANGVRDAGDSPQAGKTVYLDLNDDGVRGLSGGVEPDQHADGTILNTIHPNITLSRVDAANQPAAFNIVAVTDTRHFASTGTKAFGYGSGVDWWNDSSRLKMAFTTPVHRVSIDFSGGNVAGTEIGRLNAYNAAGALVGTYATSPLLGGADETMTVLRPTADIAYAVAYTEGGNFGMLDNLSYAIIEPSTFTAADGSFSFRDLPAGDYIVRAEVGPTYRQTFPEITARRLFVIDEFQEKIFELSPSTGAILNSFAKPGGYSSDSGLAFDGKTLFSLNSSFSGATLYELNPNTGAVLDSTLLPTSDFEGLAALGGLVYIRSRFASTISVFDPVSDSIVRTINITGVSGGSFHGLGEMNNPDRLLASDFDTLYQVDPATGAASVLFPLANDLPYGLTSVGQEIFVGFSGFNAQIDVYSRSGALLRSFNSASTPEASSLGGGGSDGGYRLRLAIGQNLTGIDFGSTEPGNAPPVAVSDSISTREDSSLSISAAFLLQNDTDERSGNLTVEKESNPSHGTLTPSADGGFSYTPEADFNGEDSFTYRANDGLLLSNVEKVVITVTAVNDPPTFHLQADPGQTVTDEQAVGTVAEAFAIDVSPGPADELTQNLVGFAVTNEDNSLFAHQPKIDGTGRLTFTPAPNVDGTTTVTVWLSDDGGTASGGVNQSQPLTFTITVTKPHRWYNAANPLNVNNSGGQVPVSSIDLLVVFNVLNSERELIKVALDAPIGEPFFYDTNRDNYVSSIDALLVVNFLNSAGAGEGEWMTPGAGSPNPDPLPEGEGEGASYDLAELISMLALDSAGQLKRCRILP